MSNTSKEFKLPDLGEGVKEGHVLRLLVQEGETVAEDQLLMEVETDKAAVEIPSPHAGVIAQLHVTENQTVNVGDVMVTFGDGTVEVAAAPRERVVEAPPAPKPNGMGATRGPATGRKPASPAVRKLARTLGVDLARVDGSGPGGRVFRRDVEAAAAGTATLAVPVVPAPAAPRSSPLVAAPPAAVPALAAPVPIAPGPIAPAPTIAPAGDLPAGRDDTDTHGAVRHVPMTATRKAIASVMSHAMATIPHVTDTDDVDVTELDGMRREYNRSAPPEQRLGMLAFVVRAVVRALQAYPIFNASFDAEQEEIVYRRYCNVAIGVQTERGLVAPVLHNASMMPIPHINAELARLADRARQGTLALDEMIGATYTISNAGAMGGSRYSTPIITPHQVAVLAIGRSRKMPWVVGDEMAPRLIMPLSHSMDHRVIDGAVEIAFMQHVIQDLEKPVRLMF